MTSGPSPERQLQTAGSQTLNRGLGILKGAAASGTLGLVAMGDRIGLPATILSDINKNNLADGESAHAWPRRADRLPRH